MLSTIFLQESKILVIPASLTKHGIVRAIVFGRWGVDYADPPKNPSGAAIYHVPPFSIPGGQSLAQVLYGDLMVLGQQVSGLGIDREPGGGQRDGLLGHVMQHLYASYDWHLGVGQHTAEDRRLFAKRFIGGCLHWMGHHCAPQCMRGGKCEQLGVMPGQGEGRKHAALRLKATMERAAKQYWGSREQRSQRGGAEQGCS